MYFYFHCKTNVFQYMEVLEINQEQKQRIETLCQEKITFAKEYEMEFNRMSVRYFLCYISSHSLLL